MKVIPETRRVYLFYYPIPYIEYLKLCNIYVPYKYYFYYSLYEIFVTGYFSQISFEFPSTNNIRVFLCYNEYVFLVLIPTNERVEAKPRRHSIVCLYMYCRWRSSYLIINKGGLGSH